MSTLPRVPARPGAAKIQNDLRILTERLARINDNLARKISSRNEYDKTIQETEGAYAKVRQLPLLQSHLATRPPIPSYPRGRLGELIPAEADLRDVPRAAAHAEPYSPLALLATMHVGQRLPSLELSHQGRRGQPGRSRPGKLPLAHSTHTGKLPLAYLRHDRSWRARKRCCMCSSGSPPT